MNNLLKQLILEGGNLFPDSERVTTKELNDCIDFIKSKIGKYFKKFESTKFLKTKHDHGDIDILVLPKEGVNLLEIINELGSSLIKFGKINVSQIIPLHAISVTSKLPKLL